MQPTEPPRIEFPCRYPIKVMGEARDVRIVWNLEKTGEETAPHPLIDPNDAPDTRSSDT